MAIVRILVIGLLFWGAYWLYKKLTSGNSGNGSNGAKTGHQAPQN